MSISPHHVFRKSVSLRSSGSTPLPVGYAEVAGSEVPAPTTPTAAPCSSTPQQAPIESGLMLSSEREDEIPIRGHVSNGMNVPPPLPLRETPASMRAPTTSPPPTLTAQVQTVDMQHPKPQVPPGPMNVPLLNRSLSVSSTTESMPSTPGPGGPALDGFGTPIHAGYNDPAMVQSRGPLPPNTNNPQAVNTGFYGNPPQLATAGLQNPQYRQQMPPVYASPQPTVSPGFSTILPPHQPLTLQSTINPRKPSAATSMIRPMSKKQSPNSLTTGANMAVTGMGTMAKASGLAIKDVFKGSGSFFVPKVKQKAQPGQYQQQQQQQPRQMQQMQQQMPMQMQQQQMSQQMQPQQQQMQPQHQQMSQQQMPQQQQGAWSMMPNGSGGMAPMAPMPGNHGGMAPMAPMAGNQGGMVPVTSVAPVAPMAPMANNQGGVAPMAGSQGAMAPMAPMAGNHGMVGGGMAPMAPMAPIAPMAPMAGNHGGMASNQGGMAGSRGGMVNGGGMAPMAPMAGKRSGMATGGGMMVNGGSDMISNRAGIPNGNPMVSGRGGMVTGRGGVTTMRNGPVGSRGEGSMGAGPMQGGLTGMMRMTTGRITGPLMAAARGGGQIRGRGSQMDVRGMQMQSTMGKTVMQPQSMTVIQNGGFVDQIPPQQMNQYSMNPLTTVQVASHSHAVPRDMGPGGIERGMSSGSPAGMSSPIGSTRGMTGPHGARPMQMSPQYVDQQMSPQYADQQMSPQYVDQQMTAQERIILQQQQQIELQNQQIAEQQRMMQKTQIQQRKMGAGGLAVGAVGGMVLAGGIAVGAAHMMAPGRGKPQLLKHSMQAAGALKWQKNAGAHHEGDQTTAQEGQEIVQEGDAEQENGEEEDAEQGDAVYREEGYIEEDTSYTESYGVYTEAGYANEATQQSYDGTGATQESYTGGEYAGGEEEDYSGGGEEYGGEEYGGGEEYAGEEYAGEADYGGDYGSVDMGGAGEELLESPPAVP